MRSTKEIDWFASRYIADAVGARAGDCCANVVRAFLQHRDELPKDAAHVEGLYDLGRQLRLHTWIETDDSIIEVTLDQAWWDVAQYYPILRRDENELEERYGERLRRRGAGDWFIMDLTRDDPRVQRLLDQVDRPPGLRRCSE